MTSFRSLCIPEPALARGHEQEPYILSIGVVLKGVLTLEIPPVQGVLSVDLSQVLSSSIGLEEKAWAAHTPRHPRWAPGRNFDSFSSRMTPLSSSPLTCQVSEWRTYDIFSERLEGHFFLDATSNFMASSRIRGTESPGPPWPAS